MTLGIRTDAPQHAWSHRDYRQFTKLAAAAHFSSCIGVCNMPMATMIATVCERHRHEPHAGAQL